MILDYGLWIKSCEWILYQKINQFIERFVQEKFIKPIVI
jgi:hypothetical protein